MELRGKRGEQKTWKKVESETKKKKSESGKATYTVKMVRKNQTIPIKMMMKILILIVMRLVFDTKSSD